MYYFWPDLTIYNTANKVLIEPLKMSKTFSNCVNLAIHLSFYLIMVDCLGGSEADELTKMLAI